MATYVLKGKGNGVGIPDPGETVYTGRLGVALKGCGGLTRSGVKKGR